MRSTAQPSSGGRVGFWIHIADRQNPGFCVTRVNVEENSMTTSIQQATAREHVHPWVAEGQGKLRYGVTGGWTLGGWSVLRDFVQTTEGLGFDSYWRPDHPTRLPDCWTMLSAVAACTRRLRIGSLVTPVFYRNPLLLASIVAAVDDVSNGRVVLGLGGGDLEDEFRAMGMSFPPIRQRQAALSEALQTIPRLLRGKTVTHADTYFKLEEAHLPSPAPQQPHVPLLVGGGGERTLRLVAEYADGSNLVPADWGGGASTPEDVQRKYAVLREHCAAVGRPFDAILRSFEFVPVVLADTPAALEAKRAQVPPQLIAFAGQAALIGTPEQAVERMRPFVEMGVQYFVLSVLELDTLRLFAERVMPALNTTRQSV
jgi:alkanesulfonate monooxygenase SsuD/methylene tetrahydromethanopterin reductase-like flavin-dependent oxidoreductase (luciferase family)